MDKTEPEVFAIIDKWRHKTGYGGIRFEYNPVDDPAMTSAQWEAMCQALAKEMGQATDPATGQLMGNTMGHQNRPPGRVRPPGEEDHRKQGAKHSIILGRVASKRDLVTRITVTLSVFNFRTCFLVQNCRESQGASF